jgi:hypothetical protein
VIEQKKNITTSFWWSILVANRGDEDESNEGRRLEHMSKAITMNQTKAEAWNTKKEKKKKRDADDDDESNEGRRL